MRAPEITPKTYRISVPKMIGLIATALIPAGVLVYHGAWHAAMQEGWGWVIGVTAFGCVTYVAHLSTIRIRLTHEGVLMMNGPRRRLHPWRIVRSVRKQERVIGIPLWRYDY